MKFFTLTKTLLLALCSTLVLVLVYLHTQGGIGAGSLGVVGKALVPAQMGVEDRTYAEQGKNKDNDPAPVTFGSDAGQANDEDLSLRGRPCDRGNLQTTDAQNADCHVAQDLAPRNDTKGMVLGDSVPAPVADSGTGHATAPVASSGTGHVSNSSNSSPSSNLQPTTAPLDFSSLGISEYQLNSLIAQQLTNLASIGLLGSGQGPSSSSPSYNSTTLQPTTPSAAPVITYIQPAPAQNFSGASLLSATDLSSTRFTTTTANITDTATIKTLSVTENATVGGGLTVTGNITGNVIGTINPSFTLGSIPFQGATGLTQDNANLFWDDTNNRLGLGTTAPTDALDLTGDLTTSRQLVIHNNYAVGAELYTHAAAGFRGPTISLMRSQGTQSAPTAVQSLDKLGYFQFFGHDGTAYQSGASIEVNTESAWSSGVTPAYMMFTTNGGTERMRITSAGNVGIGSTSPAAKLEVAAAAGLGSSPVATFSGTSTSTNLLTDYGAINVRNTNTTANNYVGINFDDGTGGAAVAIQTLFTDHTNNYGHLLFSTNGSGGYGERMRITSAGNVGIGTTTPGTNLHIYKNSGNPSVNIEAGASASFPLVSLTDGRASGVSWNIEGGRTLGALEFYAGTGAASPGTKVSIQSSGNVGIGTTSPGYQLEVNGTGTATDGLFINTAAYTSIPNPGTVSNKVILNPRGFNLSTDAATLSSGYQPTFGVGVAVNRTQPAIAVKNGATYPALVVESGYVGVGVSAPSTSFDVHHPVELGGTTSNATLIFNNSGDGGTADVNRYAHKQWLVRDATGTDWQTARLHDAVSIGNSFGTPGTDTKTWWERDPNDNIQSWGNASSTYLTINAGNVGIGTTAPGKKFVINHNTVSTISFSDTNRPYWIYDYNNGGSVQWTSGYDVSGSNDYSIANIYSGTRDVFHIENAAPANAFRIISNTGNVGLGVTAPTAALSLPNTLGQKINLYDSAGGGMMGFGVGSSELQIGGYGSGAGQHTSLGHWSATSKTFVEQVRVAHDSGNVGIGSAAPLEKLDIGTTVAGSETGSANIRFTDTAVSSGTTYYHAIKNTFNGVVASDQMNFYLTNAGTTVNPLTLVANGNVGIGTTAPSSKLDVAGSISSDIGGGVGSYRAGGNRVLYSDTVSTYVGNLDASKTLSLVAGTNTGATILANGNVGIGTTVPAYRLSVTPTANEVALHLATISGADSGFYITPHAANDTILASGAVYASAVFRAKTTTAEILNMYGGGFDFYGDTGLTAGNTYTPTLRMTLTPTGNVGIGTTSPGYKLDVAGTGQFQDNLTVLASSSSKGLTITSSVSGNAGDFTIRPNSSAVGSPPDFTIATNANARLFFTAYAALFSGSVTAAGITSTAGLTNTGLFANTGNARFVSATTNTDNVVYFNAGTDANKAAIIQKALGSYSRNDLHFAFNNSTNLTNVAVDGTDTKVIFKADGNVGIGTTAPGKKLDVYTDGGELRITGSTGNNFLTAETNGGSQKIQVWAGGAVGLLSDNDTHIGNLNQTTFQMSIIKSSGNVGVGTTTPAGALHVANAVTRQILLNRTEIGTTTSDGTYMGTASGNFELVNQEAGYLRFYTNGADVMRMAADGNIGIGTTTPGSKLDIGSTDLGNGTAGPVITLGRNTNATNTGAGSINFQSKAGTAGYVWQDNAGNLRIHTAAPSNANDTAGTVVGAQTSTRDTKQDIQEYTDYAGALQAVINAPLRTFRYIREVEGYGTASPLAKNHIGFIADEVSGDFMQGNSIDQVSVNGLLMASVKALDERIKNQELRIKELEIATSQSLLAMTEGEGGSVIARSGSADRGNLNNLLSVLSYNANSNYVIITKQLYLSGDSVGQAKILAGATSVRITFSKPYEQQPIVTVTATGESALVGDFRYAVVEKDATGFTIKINSAQGVDLEFDYHVFASPEAKLTVSDGTRAQLVLVVPTPVSSTLNQGQGDENDNDPAPVTFGSDAGQANDQAGADQASATEDERASNSVMASSDESSVPTPTGVTGDSGTGEGNENNNDEQ